MAKEIAVNQIVVPTYYIVNEDGSITYDFEMMAEEFENKLSKLDDSVVVMCSVEDRERVIEEIQKINCYQRNNIFELAVLDNKELLERLDELMIKIIKCNMKEMKKMQVLKSILLEKLKPNPNKKLIQKLQQMADKCFSKKIYLDNHIFMELIGELATNITEMNFGAETYGELPSGTIIFGDEAQEYYNETYDQYETLFNNFAKIYPKI